DVAYVGGAVWIGGSLRIDSVAVVVQGSVVDVGMVAVDADVDVPADDEHRPLGAMVCAVGVLLDAPTELAPKDDAEFIGDSHVGAVIVEELDPIADLAHQVGVTAGAGALVCVRIEAADR